jgi:hypothetical protein
MAGPALLGGLESRVRASTSNRLMSGTKRKAIDLVDSDSDDKPIAFTESKVFSMSNITMSRTRQLRKRRDVRRQLKRWSGRQEEQEGE